MAESSTIDFSEYLQNDLKWYNAYWALGADDFGNGKRGESRTLHLFQSFTKPVVCGLSLEGKTLKKVYIYSRASAQLRFSIGGGMEIPHFRVTLRLQIPKQNPRELVAVWTAWAEDRVTAFDLQTRGNDAKKSSFSTRLFDAHLEPITLTKGMAISCQSDEGKEAYRVLWSHATAPYCFGFDIPDSTLEKLEPEQRTAIKNFRKIWSGNLQLEAVTRVRGHLGINWKILQGMSQPTYPPYPLYDARYQSQAQKMAPISEIPSLDDQNIQKHHRRRELRWSNDPSGRPRYTEKEAIFCFSPSPAPTFVNERQYEAIRMIGLLREVEAAKKAYVSLFNREYTFQLFAASSVHGGPDSDVFYAVLEVQVDSDNAEHEQGLLPLPEPRTGVKITPKVGQHQTTRGSGKDKDWSGVVVSSSTVQEQEGNLPVNRIVVRVNRPNIQISAGIVLTLTGDVVFGNQTPPFASARKAIHNVMWGNSGLGIAENTALKRLLLGYNNSTLSLYPPERQVDADTENFLTGLQSRRNAKQLEAIREVFATRKTSRSLATLITGPPGTGKTAVSASIAEWCIKQNLPLLIVAGSNHALDMIGQRIMSTVREQSLGLSGIYRLETDYLETPEIQTSEAQTSARQNPAYAQFQKIQEVFEEHDLPDVQNFLRASVESVSPPFRDLSLGQFIITRAALAGTRNCPLKDGSAEDQAEYELLSEFICWQHCMRERAMLLVEAVAAITYPGAGPQQQAEDLQKVIGREYQQAWVELQKFYLEQAKVVLCTASTAGRGILRTFKPAYVLVEEASQLSEAECLNGIMAGVPSLQKIVLSGDKQQLPPTVISNNRNECYFWEKESLFERLIRSGHPHIELNVQYRMAPDIAEFVSKQFYDGRLTTDPTSAQRPQIKHWADTMKDLLRCSAGNSFFVSVADSTVLKRLGGSSLVNPEYVSYVGELVQKVLKKGCVENRIMISLLLQRGETSAF